MLEQPFFLGAVVGDSPVQYSAREMRLLADAVFATEGVCGTSHYQVSQRAAGANASVDVAAGIVVVAGDTGTAQGKYVLRNNGTVNFTAIPALPVSGTRRHLLCVHVNDRQSGDVTYVPEFLVVQDLIGSGALPQAPVNACPLAEIRRTAGQAGGTSVTAATIFDARPTASVLAGPTYTGWFYAVTDSGGYATVPLSSTLGYVPSAIVCGIMGTVGGVPNIPAMIAVSQPSINAANFQVRVWAATGAVYANSALFVTYTLHR